MSRFDQDDLSDWGPDIDCWQCGGDGENVNCFEEFACIDPEGGCDLCVRPCDICNGKGGWEASDAAR